MWISTFIKYSVLVLGVYWLPLCLIFIQEGHSTFMWWTWEIIEFKSQKKVQTPVGIYQVWVLRSKHFMSFRNIWGGGGCVSGKTLNQEALLTKCMSRYKCNEISSWLFSLEFIFVACCGWELPTNWPSMLQHEAQESGDQSIIGLSH